MENKVNKILIVIIFILVIIIGLLIMGDREEKKSIENFANMNAELYKEKEDLNKELSDLRYKYETLKEQNNNK